MSEWQPIGTAPRQRPVIICRRRWLVLDPTKPHLKEDIEFVANARLEREYGTSASSAWVVPSLGGEGTALTLLSQGWLVTHWMPMPEVPAMSLPSSPEEDK